MLVGEQPGDEEDLRGRPFVGPAGRVLDEALDDTPASIAASLFITNAVKHFKWQPRGKRRLHKRPDAREVSACNHWLDAEVAQMKPRIIVALGASALRAVAGLTDSIESARAAANSASPAARRSSAPIIPLPFSAPLTAKPTCFVSVSSRTCAGARELH